ncbi:MAG: class I SAM-dependent methyltransferase [Candidatus Thorarchaeota archaeon]
MIAKARAWKELLKLGLNVQKLRKDIDCFFRGNVVRILESEGWFEYLHEPRTEYEIATQFRYTDFEFLRYLLDILVEDETLVKDDGRGYKTNGGSSDEWICPTCFDGAMEELWTDHAKAIPERLRGQYLTFTGGLNLFNWDDALSNRLYEQIRRSAFSFASALKKPVRLLDIGSGNGRGTAAIWHYYYQNRHFYHGSRMEIVGIEPSEKLNVIAREEFLRMVEKRDSTDEVMAEYVNNCPPTFVQGYAESIPFNDDHFDVVYASQVLHWTDPRKAIREMIRVTRPGGYVFGTQNFYPDGNKFNEAHFKVVKGAHGFFLRDEMIQWAEEAGAKKVEIATPIAVFKISL